MTLTAQSALNFSSKWTVYASVAQELLQVGEYLGCAKPALLRSAGIAPMLIRTTDQRIAAQGVYRLYQNIERISGNPDVGLYAAKVAHVNCLELQQGLAKRCNTLRAYLNELPDVLALSGDLGQVRVHTSADQVHIQWQPLLAQTAQDRYLSDAVLGTTYLMISQMCLGSVPLQQAYFSYPKPHDCNLLNATFGHNLRFSQLASGLVIHRAQLDQPICAFNGINYEQRLQGPPQDKQAAFLHNLRIAIADLLPHGTLTLGALASDLHVSKRTLQRRLNQCQTQFVQVVQDVRMVLAKKYVLQGRISLAESAYLLGYANQSSFSKAFKLWYGCAPSVYAQQGTV